MNAQELLRCLEWRYATKIFDPSKKISAADWKALEEALVLSPSSYGLQPWKFLVVTDRDVREKLITHSWGQKQVVDCSHYVVFLGANDVALKDVERWVKRMAEVKGVPTEALKTYQDMMVSDLVQGPRHAWIAEWAARQVYIALGNFMTSAAVMGIDTCPMEGLDPVQYDKILGLQGSGYSTRVACAAGYRSASDKYAQAPKIRYKHDEVLRAI
jgi:nitroreductase